MAAINNHMDETDDHSSCTRDLRLELKQNSSIKDSRREITTIKQVSDAAVAKAEVGAENTDNAFNKIQSSVEKLDDLENQSRSVNLCIKSTGNPHHKAGRPWKTR